MEEKTQHPMTKDKILSAEEFLWKFIMTTTGDPETDMPSIEYMIQIPGFSKMVEMLKDYTSQFQPPTMTEDDLRKEAEREYPKFPFWDDDLGGFQKKLREAHITARKMGAIQLTTK